MQSFILKENVLTDDILHLPDEGKIFKGGYIAKIEYFTFLHAWGDEKHTIKFRNANRLNSFLKKKYPEVELPI